MTRILLTGAGFSRNWGGWLASEAFEYLLGCTEIDEETRLLLWRSKEAGAGFEETLANLQIAKDADGKRRFRDLTEALVGMFNGMGQGFAQRRTLEFRDPPDVRYAVKTFLARFDAIFTLNQDTLLEQHYLDFAPIGGRWGGAHMPGLRLLNPAAQIQGPALDRLAMKQPDPDNFRVAGGMQPYFKLHGSCNWVEGPTGDRILVMGGAKAINIRRFPILNWYHDLFNEFISRAGARLMVIGYSFSDKHINDAIERGIERGLKIFIIDPSGVDVLDKRPDAPIGRPKRDEYMAKLAPHIIGASRRLLRSIFDDDVVEHGKIMKFFPE